MSEFLFVHSLVDDAGLSPIEFRVLGTIKRRQGQNGHAWPSLETIAKTCRVRSISTVRKALKGLEEKGVITTMPRHGTTPLRYMNPVSEWQTDPCKKMVGVGKRTWGSPDKQMPTPAKKCEGSKKGGVTLSKSVHPPLAKNETQRKSPESNPTEEKAPNPLKGVMRWRNKILVDELYDLFPRKEGRRAKPGEKFRDKFELGKVLQHVDAETIRAAIIRYKATLTPSQTEPGSYVGKPGRYIDSLSNWCVTEGWKVIHHFAKAKMNDEANGTGKGVATA